MTDGPSFLTDPADTREAIMRATYLALCEDGYADLTIQGIGEHFEKSKSLLYHHYDSKDELLLDFLDFMLSEFEEAVPGDDDTTPDDHLAAVVDHVVADTVPDDQREFGRAMAELRAQAAHDDRYRDHFTRSDRVFHENLASVVRRGVENGDFRDVDPDHVAAFLLTVVQGAMTKRVTSDAEFAPTVRAEIRAYLDQTVRTDDAE